jgi:DNA-binding NarL/FixJ family response regulator
MIQVVVADDHALVRDGLKLLIDGQPDMRVTGEAGDGRQVIRCLRSTSCDVLVLDLVMPGGGLQVLRYIRQKGLDVRTLVLTMHDKPTYVRQAMAAGANGYLVKSAAASELLDAIRRIHWTDLRPRRRHRPPIRPGPRSGAPAHPFSASARYCG